MDDIFLDKTMTNGEPGQFNIIYYTKLLKQAVTIGAGGLWAQTELFRYPLVRLTFYNHQHHLRLTLRQLFKRCLVTMIHE